MNLKKRINYLSQTNGKSRILLFLPIYIYKRAKRLRFRFSNYIFSHYYYYSSKLIRCNEINISVKKLGQNNVIFPHPIGIVIGNHVEIGKRVVIYQNVTLGTRSINADFKGEYPIIEDNVIIYANSILIGNIRIGKNSVIGAGSIITKDLPSESIAYGINKIKPKINKP